MAMTCPKCDAWCYVKSTRASLYGPRRIYECGNKHRFATLEFPVVATKAKPQTKKEKK